MAEDLRSPTLLTAQSLGDWRNHYPLAQKQRKLFYNECYDPKDPNHPVYRHTQRQRAEHHHLWQADQSKDSAAHALEDQKKSKDRANLEALEDPALIPSTARDIPSNVPPEALPLDATVREDTMREDAPLATSHDTSLSLP
jgi:hypothetical protein